MWSSIQVLPNQVSKKSFYTFKDIDLSEFHAKVYKKPSETPGADSILTLNRPGLGRGADSVPPPGFS